MRIEISRYVDQRDRDGEMAKCGFGAVAAPYRERGRMNSFCGMCAAKVLNLIGTDELKFMPLGFAIWKGLFRIRNCRVTTVIARSNSQHK